MYAYKVCHHSKGGGQLPFHKPLEGLPKACRGCLASELASTGKLMCLPKMFATFASLGVVGPTNVDHQARQRPTPLTSSTFLTTV